MVSKQSNSMLTCVFVYVRETDREEEERDSTGVKRHSNIHIHSS